MRNSNGNQITCIINYVYKTCLCSGLTILDCNSCININLKLVYIVWRIFIKKHSCLIKESVKEPKNNHCEKQNDLDYY